MHSQRIVLSRSLRSYSDGHPLPTSVAAPSTRSLSPHSILTVLQEINANHTPERRQTPQQMSMDENKQDGVGPSVGADAASRINGGRGSLHRTRNQRPSHLTPTAASTASPGMRI